MTQYAPLQQQLKDWKLQHDNQCFLTIQNFTESLMNKANEIYQSFQDTDYNLNNYFSVVNNNFSKFINISNVKFTENKLEESKLDDFQQEKPKENIQQPEPDSIIKQRFKTAVECAINGCNLESYIDQSDANEENLSQTGSSDERLSQFSSLTAARGNNFPAIIGSQAFMNDQFIGIKIEEIVPQIQVDTVAPQQTIVPGKIEMVQSNLPIISQPPQINQTNIAPPTINMQANIQQPPQINQQLNIPQPPQLQQSNIIQPQIYQSQAIPQPPQMPQQSVNIVISSLAPPPPTIPQQVNIVASSAAPPPPKLNLMPKPPALPSLPKPVQKKPQQQQKQEEKPKNSQQSIQDAFQQKLREMQEKKNKSQIE